jgi:hypothetical protein
MTMELAAKFPEWSVDPVNLQRHPKAYDWLDTYGCGLRNRVIKRVI